MSTTPNMQLVVPEVLVTTGPQYATQVNTALDVIDSHDHSAGKGVRITPSGLNINGDLSFGNNQAVNLKALVLASQTSVATVGAAYNKNGDLFWRNGAGNEVQLTTGGSVNVSGVGGITGLSGTSASASYTNLSQVFSWLSDASTYAKTDTGDLTIYSRSGAVGAISGVTLVADVATSAYSLRLPASGPADNQIMRMKAATAGAFVDLLGTNNQVTVTHNTSNITLALPQNIHTAATPTFASLTLTGGANITGAVNAGSLVSTGAISGTTGSFTGNVSTSADMSCANIGISSNITGNPTFTGNVTISGASATLTATGTTATFKSVTINNTLTATAATVNMNQLNVSYILPYPFSSTASTLIKGAVDGNAIPFPYIGEFNVYGIAGSGQITTSASYQTLIAVSVLPGIWEINANVSFIFDADNDVSKIRKLDCAISLSASSPDNTAYYATQSFPTVTGALYQNELASQVIFSRIFRTSTTQTIYLIGRTLISPFGGTNQGRFISGVGNTGTQLNIRRIN